ncbi:Histone-lysine N-methyltransferase ASHR3 [Fusarium oxysporum f. sp. albedinis]|nr:Histone-lysine N-methyltransferase ASHR3 [Fusarium oxysporum f. sp. albedinis]
MAKLDMITDSSLHFSQTQSSINDLELLRSPDRHSWSPETELTLQGAKLYLYAMTLLLPPSKEPVVALQSISDRDAVLISGLMSASTMISDMLHQLRDKPNQGSDKITCSAAFWPKTQISYLFFAATFIFRVLLSHSSLTPQDITLAMSRLADAHAVFRMEPLHPDRTRAAEIIQRLIEVARAYMVKDEGKSDAKNLLPRGLLVTGRLGASVMFDAVLRSVHYHKQSAQRRKSRPRNEVGIYQIGAPIPGTELRIGGEVHIYGIQVSCLITGIDEDSWVAYQFVDIYHQGDKPLEYGEQHGVKPDSLTRGLFDANLPIWTPKEYFLIFYECRLKQVRHAMHKLVARLFLRESWSRWPRRNSRSEFSTKQTDFYQTIHSICKAIEVWDRFSRIDLAYLSNILKSDSKKSPIPSDKIVTMIEDHIDELRDLQRRAEEQRDLCTGLARKLCEERGHNEVTARQQAGSEMTRYWAGIVLVRTCITLLVLQAIRFQPSGSTVPILVSNDSCRRATPLHPITLRFSLLSSSTDYPAKFKLIPRSPGRTV